jgi:hypothetical protein
VQGSRLGSEFLGCRGVLFRVRGSALGDLLNLHDGFSDRIDTPRLILTADIYFSY